MIPVEAVEKIVTHVESGRMTRLEAYGEIVTLAVVARRRRVDVVENATEFAAVAHVRGWCHDSTACPVCRAYKAGERWALRDVAEGTPL